MNRQAAVDKMSTGGLVIRDREIVLDDILTKPTCCHHSMAVHQWLPGQALIDSNFAVPTKESKFHLLA